MLELKNLEKTEQQLCLENDEKAELGEKNVIAPPISHFHRFLVLVCKPVLVSNSHHYPLPHHTAPEAGHLDPQVIEAGGHEFRLEKVN